MMGQSADFREKGQISLAEVWMIMHPKVLDKPFGLPKLKDRTKGWVVTVPDDAILHASRTSDIIQLRPGDTIFPHGDNHKAQQQLKTWEQQLGGPVVFLIVQDFDQPEVGVLAQPVKLEWFTKMSLTDLQDRYIAFAGKPEASMYRAAIIARTGQPPQ